MRDILDLDRYPSDKPGSPAWFELVETCRANLAVEGMFNLEGFVRPDALIRAMTEIKPVMETLHSSTSGRITSISRRSPGLAPDHPALRTVDTVNHTVCSDQISAERAAVDLRVASVHSLSLGDFGEGRAVYHA